MSLKKILDLFEKENKFKTLQVGEVVENKDPLKIGQIKINIPNFTEGISPDILPWSHQIFPVGTGTSTGIPTFKVRCKLQNMSLTYKSNTVNVKKGMTVNANFFLTRRTLAQLFYDDISDWLNPNVMTN